MIRSRFHEVEQSFWSVQGGSEVDVQAVVVSPPFKKLRLLYLQLQACLQAKQAILMSFLLQLMAKILYLGQQCVQLAP